jgi:hypothetical protein
MSTTRISARRLVVLTVAVAITAASGIFAGGAATADAGSDQDAYVASLLTRHEASRPYTAMDDYVRTLVFWHGHPGWTVR